ncbi:MAG: TRAP transporter large permease [Deltaproteobacteria bacterium]|nr:TRAP transporter large permease [Deltaproteobacteria bacterium]
MSAEMLALVGIIVLVVLFLLRMPVAFTMGFVGFFGFAIMTSFKAALGILSKDIWANFSSYALTVVPMFILMGSLISYSGIAERLYNSAHKVFGHLPGGIAIATCYACAAFGACCGSTTAAAATMGKVALPAMRKYKYDLSLSSGCVASAGSLAILIPPSTILIIYGILTEQSIGKLFIAGIIPGIILATIFALTVFIICKRRPKLGPPAERTSFKEKVKAIGGLVEVMILFIVIMGGLVIGIFTPTEAGAAGAFGALLIALIRKQLRFKDLLSALAETTRITAMIFLILFGATVFGHFMAVTRVPFTLSEWIGNLQVSPYVIMSFIIFGYLIGGCFMDSLALITLTVPIIYPVVIKLGFDPIWFGVIIVLVTEMGVITPPVGINVYVLKSVAPDVPMETIFRGIFPFLAGIIVCAALLIIFPEIATYLPKFITY